MNQNSTWSFAKGHGTLNDFVILVDRDNENPLSSSDVRKLCDRRAGVGADGVLRAIEARHIDGWNGDPELWFMDYRNADGSIAEMCGNGLRVFVRYLLDAGLLEPGAVRVGTRAGERCAVALDDGRIRTAMGTPIISSEKVRIDWAGGSAQATRVNVGNPHAVVELETIAQVEELNLSVQPTWAPVHAYPDGTNVEFIAEIAPGHLRMRVHERGVGETWSCGTGVVAAAAAYCHARGQAAGTVRVDVPGGSLEVTMDDEVAQLTGPAVVVFRGEATID